MTICRQCHDLKIFTLLAVDFCDKPSQYNLLLLSFLRRLLQKVSRASNLSTLPQPCQIFRPLQQTLLPFSKLQDSTWASSYFPKTMRLESPHQTHDQNFLIQLGLRTLFHLLYRLLRAHFYCVSLGFTALSSINPNRRCFSLNVGLSSIIIYKKGHLNIQTLELGVGAHLSIQGLQHLSNPCHSRGCT